MAFLLTSIASMIALINGPSLFDLARPEEYQDESRYVTWLFFSPILYPIVFYIFTYDSTPEPSREITRQMIHD